MGDLIEKDIEEKEIELTFPEAFGGEKIEDVIYSLMAVESSARASKRPTFRVRFEKNGNYPNYFFVITDIWSTNIASLVDKEDKVTILPPPFLPMSQSKAFSIAA